MLNTTTTHNLPKGVSLETIQTASREYHSSRSRGPTAYRPPQFKLDASEEVIDNSNEEAVEQPKDNKFDLEINRLAKLTKRDYHKERKDVAKALGISLGALDGIVKEAQDEAESGSAELVKTVEPWEEPIVLGELLDEVRKVFDRYIICEATVKTAATLWVAYSWCIEHVPFAPLAVITAPEKACGKTQLLEVMGRLSRKSLVASGISPAALFRVVEAERPTLLIDETDTFLKSSEELRGIINSGHSRVAPYVIRTVGENFDPKAFNVFGAKVLCGIGKMPDTIMSRAIVLPMRRKLPSEKVARLRHADPNLFHTLSRKLARFEADFGKTVGDAQPSMPEELGDRDQDNWETLIAIADLAGGVWPQIARSAALQLCKTSGDKASPNEELLSDIRDAFEKKRASRLSSVKLLEVLLEDPEAPWATWNNGRPMSGRQLGKRLRDFGVIARTVTVERHDVKGFKLEQFTDAFERYLGEKQRAPDDEISSPENVF